MYWRGGGLKRLDYYKEENNNRKKVKLNIDDRSKDKENNYKLKHDEEYLQMENDLMDKIIYTLGLPKKY